MAHLVGYARCSTDAQDLAIQREQLARMGVGLDRIYQDPGFTGKNRERPGLGQALAAVREGDTLVVTKLDRLARSVPDARSIADSLVVRGIKLRIGETVYDPTDPFGKMFFNCLAMFAEFEGDMISMRTKEGMNAARDKGHLRGKQPKLKDDARAGLLAMHGTGRYNVSELGRMFGISRPTVYRELARARSAR
jgi:DNA invertase Pin-like site-specific DNA recombinase